MPLSGVAVAEIAIGGVVLYSGVRGATIAATFSALAKGQTPPDTETVTWGTGTDSAGGAARAASGAPSGSSTANLRTIASYLMSQGFTEAAAAGVAGVIAGESSGNPEANSGSGVGLIQWTGSSQSASMGYTPLTGNATKDLDAQLPGIIKYIESRGGNALNMLKNMTDPNKAAQLFSSYEAPAVAGSDIDTSVVTEIYDWLTGSGSGTGVT